MSAVSLHWGDVANLALTIFAPAISAAIVGGLAWLITKYAPPSWLLLLKQLRVNQLLEKAIGAGIAKTEGAVAGKTLEVSIANQVLAEALQYLASQAPKLVKQFGPKLEDMLIARLGESGMLPPDAHKGNLAAAKPLLQP
jgi:hypothetical protein